MRKRKTMIEKRLLKTGGSLVSGIMAFLLYQKDPEKTP